MNEMDIENINKEKILNYISDVTFSTIQLLASAQSPTIWLKQFSNHQNLTRLNFSNPHNAKKFALYFKLLSIIQNLIESDQYASKRDILYQFKHLFKSQEALDRLINHISRTIDVPRCALRILASSKGLVVGDLDIILKDGTEINCRINTNGTPIPNLIHSIQKLKTSSNIVLIVEKHATFMRLIDDNFLVKYPIILITGKGEPDVNTRELCNLIWREFGAQMIFVALTDANPFGIQIMSVYKHGSKFFSHANLRMNVPSLEWIGLKLTDLEKFDLPNPDQFTMKLNEHDRSLGKELLKRLEEWEEYDLKNELEFMLKSGFKAELQYLQNLNNSFLCDIYLRAKLDAYLKR